jgi:hypothetical protein
MADVLAKQPQAATDASADAQQLQFIHHNAYKHCYKVGRIGVQSALGLLSNAEQTVLGSVQGQQLLQSCMSLLLTCNSLLQSKRTVASPGNMSMYVELLQLLQRSAEALAGGGSSCGMSQSLAAGLVLAGRTLVTLGTYLSTRMPDDCSFNPFLTFTPQNILHMRGLLEWLSACSEVSDDERPPQEPGAQQGPPVSAHASILLQAMQNIASCVRSIKQNLQQRAAAAKAAAAGAGSNDSMSYQSSSTGSSSHASSGSSNPGVHSADAVQGRDQQQQQQLLLLLLLQQAPADWLLAGMDRAQGRCDKACSSMRKVLRTWLPNSNASGEDFLSAVMAPVSEVESLPDECVAAGEALCAAVPCSACCSNPRCTNMGGVSAGFALVRGKGCVCGGCLGLRAGGPVPALYQGPLVAAR